MKTNLYILIILLSFTSCSNNKNYATDTTDNPSSDSTTVLVDMSYSQDLLENITSNSKLVNELKDVYRAFRVNNIIMDQMEMLIVSQEAGSEVVDLLDKYIEIYQELKTIQFNDDTLNSQVNEYLTLLIQSYKIAKEKGLSDSEFKKAFAAYNKSADENMAYLYSTYSTPNFINMTEDEYWLANDKNTYITSPAFGIYKSLKKNDLKKSLATLEVLIKETSDFQESSIYQIELADQYVKNIDVLADNAHEIAIEKYKAVIDQKNYSIYLFEAWLKWRLVTQQHIHGLSVNATIPNTEYDKMREQVAFTILDYITKNEKDEMAINQFLLIATHDIVKRFGPYEYGNQNTVEYHQTFDE